MTIKPVNMSDLKFARWGSRMTEDARAGLAAVRDEDLEETLFDGM